MSGWRRAMGTAALLGLCAGAVDTSKAGSWAARSAHLREQMRGVLTLPDERVSLAPEIHRRITGEGYRIESLTYASEPGSRVTALLYLPAERRGRVPAIVLACGHGGSKSCLYAQYAGQLYAKLGFALLAPDTIGEEERHVDRKMGARGHDLYLKGEDTEAFVRTKLKRMVLGKITWDLMRGIDYLETREEVDGSRIGIMGYSLGGASAGSVAVLDDRVDAALICGWAFRGRYGEYSKYCTRMPYAAFTRLMGYDEMTALLAPHAATLFMVGEKDEVIDPDERGAATVRELKANVAGARRILQEAGVEGEIEAVFEPDADHRPYFLSRRGAAWMQSHLMRPEERRAVSEATVPFGAWADGQGHAIERLYNTEARERGLEAVDVGAVYREPAELACFPAEWKPTAEYTMAGWVERTVKANADEPPLTELGRARTYRNPLIAEPYMADPHVIRVDDTYYLYPTSHTRGYDAYVSEDLVRWGHKGTVFDDPRGGAWAPDVFHHRRGGKFYLYYTDNLPNGPRGTMNKQIGVAAADGPLGPFVDQRPLASEAIDAHLFQDDDGRLYLYYVHLAGGFKILVQPMADPLTKRGETAEVIRPTEDWEKVSGEVTEGPFMLKRGGTYYLMYSGTGADSPDYAIGYATARSPMGPFEKHPGNPIVRRRENLFGPGHHCVVEGPDGTLWMIYHQKVDEGRSFKRFAALDPLWFDDAGVIHARVSKGTDEPVP